MSSAPDRREHPNPADLSECGATTKIIPMKSKSVIEKVSRRGSEAVPGSQFWVIDTGTRGEHHGSHTATGPFASMSSAEKWLRKEAEETYLDADKSLRDLADEQGWDSPMHIVEMRKTVTTVPSVKVTVRLKTENSD